MVMKLNLLLRRPHESVANDARRSPSILSAAILTAVLVNNIAAASPAE
jgi:hypothetical protein